MLPVTPFIFNRVVPGIVLEDEFCAVIVCDNGEIFFKLRKAPHAEGLKVTGRAVLSDNASGNIVARRDLQRTEVQGYGWLLFADAAYAHKHEEFTLFFQLEVEALFIKFHDEHVRYLPPPTVLVADSEKALSTSQRIVDLSKCSRRVCEVFLTWMDSYRVPLPDSQPASEFNIPGLDAVESQLFFAEIWGLAVQHKFYNILSSVAKCCGPRQFWYAAHLPDFNRLRALYNLMLPEHDMDKAAILVDYAFENFESIPDADTFPLGTVLHCYVTGEKKPPTDSMTLVLERLQANRLHTLQRVLLKRLGAPDWMLKCCMPLLETRRKRKRSSSDV